MPSDASHASLASRPSHATGDAVVDECASLSTDDEGFTQCLKDRGLDPSDF